MPADTKPTAKGGITVEADVITPRTNKAIDIKGNMVTFMSVVLHVNDLDQIRESLTQRVLQAPAFFKNTPVIVDFSGISINSEFDFNALFKTVRQQKLLPVAVRGIDPDLQEKFQSMGVPIVESSRVGMSKAKFDENTKRSETKDHMQSSSTLIVDALRSDDQPCLAEDGDLIVTAQTSIDTGLMAHGSIHVYGTLRGRAMCGIHGDKSARIFCSALDAQLVSVAGFYTVLETIPPTIKNKPVQVRLDKDQLLIEPLERK